MDIPREFKDVCAQFHEGIHLHCDSIEDMVRIALRLVDRRQGEVAMAFLDELLSGRYDADQLQDVWHSTSADIYFPKAEELLAVLTTMQRLLLVKVGAER